MMLRRIPHLVHIAMLFLLAQPLPATPSERSCASFDHGHDAWSKLLERRVEAGFIDYAGWKREDAAALDSYLRSLEAACASDYASWSRERRLAFWINAYNAYTIRLILDEYPVDSIRSIGWLPGAAFRREFIPMQGLRGRTLSLQAIEDDILRGEFSEPRIHFAIVCASKGCPRLASEAYVGDRLEEQLEAAARGFLADPFRNRWDPEKRVLGLSSIFRWFAADFEKPAGTILDYVRLYLPGPVATATREPGLRVEFLDYDWTLNGR